MTRLIGLISPKNMATSKQMAAMTPHQSNATVMHRTGLFIDVCLINNRTQPPMTPSKPSVETVRRAAENKGSKPSLSELKGIAMPNQPKKSKNAAVGNPITAASIIRTIAWFRKEWQ